jgi:serine/threonine protein kinase
MAVPAVDRLIADRYALTSACGPSGLGRVWHAQDTLLGRQVEVREVVVPPWLAEGERREALAAAMREAGAIARLNHPGVLTLFDVVRDHVELFIVTELVQSLTLADLVLSRGPLPPMQVAEIGAEVASVLEAAHGAGIVHRDVRPANVMVDQDGGVRLAGFGVTSVQSLPPSAGTALAIGSPSYVAPEQVRGKPSGPAADLWALGATMYFAVEGEPPFDKGTLIRTLAAVVNEEPRPMLRAGPLAALLMAMLAKNPDERLSALKVRVWLRWLVEVAYPASPSEVLPPQLLDGTVPLRPTARSCLPQPAKMPMTPIATATTRRPEGPASEPDKAPTVEPSAETARAEPRAGPAPLPAPPVRRQARGWLVGVLAFLAAGGLLVAWLAGALRPDRTGEERAAPAMARGAVDATGTTQPAPSTTRAPATTEGRRTATSAAPERGLPAGWRAFTNRAGNSRVGVPPGFRVRTRQRYHAAVVEEQGGARRVFTVRSQNPSARLPQASRDYRAWARGNFAGFREVRYQEDQSYAGRKGAVVFEYEAVRDGRRVHVSHINVKGRTWGYNVEFIVPAGHWDASKVLARQFEHAFQPLG